MYGIYFRETPYQTKQANDKLYEGVELPTKNIDLPLNTEIMRQVYGLMMEDEKDVLAGGI